ncbi:uncharacterized protein LOC122047860 [Zingiber officinale]|uniref:Borealin C-terminal domain-containing protein n=1 Tax=Zingiber officinale TaxID=94328 RepID=A0A8J5M3L0_ZINOF|nr:uncharacterized protein LOC122040294 [Zingiber officinale]XP_042465305.1 uncharacterized protein LOC122047860 [Zingiber officinale]KAG6530464.1 hypothetical protein ZIOFF_012703 [Zingiber officinale]
MPKKGRKKAVKKSPLRTKLDENVFPIENRTMQFKKRQLAFSQREVEMRTAAIKANCEVELGSLLSWVRLLPSYFSKDQLDTPALKFFQENLPNAALTRNEKYNVFEMQWNSKESCYEGGKYDRASVSNAFTIPAMSALQFSVDTVKRNLEAANLWMNDFGLGEPSESGQATFETPGATTARLSFGMTPKTLRLPKIGEMILSVHGSPLGVYKEEILEAIHESGDGSHEDAC